ncbi:MAG: hypothetical protein VW268_10270 [Rhodospirillaceae bacterium]
MKYTKTSIGTATAVAAAIATGSAIAPARSKAETVIRLSTYVNEGDIRHDGFKHFADLVAKKPKPDEGADLSVVDPV